MRTISVRVSWTSAAEICQQDGGRVVFIGDDQRFGCPGEEIDAAALGEVFPDCYRRERRTCVYRKNRGPFRRRTLCVGLQRLFVAPFLKQRLQTYQVLPQALFGVGFHPVVEDAQRAAIARILNHRQDLRVPLPCR